MAGYIRPLKTMGFRTLQITPSAALLFENTLQEFSNTKRFRFPPQEGATFDSWPQPYKDSYFQMESIARSCFSGLVSELDELGATGEVELDECLKRKDISFETSFMNIFNYKYGYLKPHRDRCLVTIVYRQYLDAQMGQNEMTNAETDLPATKTLWSHDIDFTASENKCRWINVDNSLCSAKNQACMFIGEEMSALCGHYLTANEHCVTENPNLPYCNTSGSQINRMSLALVLSSPTISNYIEKSFS